MELGTAWSPTGAIIGPTTGTSLWGADEPQIVAGQSSHELLTLLVGAEARGTVVVAFSEKKKKIKMSTLEASQRR